MSRYGDSSLASGLGRRRKRRGRGILSDLIGSIGLGRKRRRVHRRKRRRVHRRRRRVGRGVLDVIRKVVSVAAPFIKKSGVVGHAIGMIPGIGGIASGIARSAGWGRKRRVQRRVGGVRRKRAGILM
jgi:TctA family transporter